MSPFLPQIFAIDVMRASALFLLLAACSRAGAGPTPIVGLPCEDCDVPLIGLPADPPALAQLAPAMEPGEHLRLTGQVTDAQGRPRQGAVSYTHLDVYKRQGVACSAPRLAMEHPGRRGVRPSQSGMVVSI